MVYPLLVMIDYNYLFCTLRNEWRVASVLNFLPECNTGKSNEAKEKKSLTVSNVELGIVYIL